MIVVRRAFLGIFFFLLASTLILTFLVPVLLPPGTNTQEGFYRSIPFKLIVLLSLLVIVAWFWTFLSLRSVSLHRRARILRQQVGQVFEERFEVINKGPVTSVVLEVLDQSPLPGKQSSKVLSNIHPRQERSYIARTLLTRRGAFQLGPTLLRSGDPFGLFAYTKEFSGEQTLLVLPMVVDLDRFVSPSGFLPGGRVLHQRSPEVTPYAAGVREYMPGDPLSRIHWRSTARRDQLMVKEFEQDPLADVWVFIDAQQAVHYEQESQPDQKTDPFWMWKNQQRITLPQSTFEYAMSAAASVVNLYIRQGRAVGLAAAGRRLAILSPERGERQLSKILETLAFLGGDGKMPVAGLVEAQAPHLARGSTVVLVTPNVTSSVEVAVDELMRRDLRPVLILVDPSSFGGRGQTGELTERIQAGGVPACSLRYGDNLKTSLESCGTLHKRFDSQVQI